MVSEQRPAILTKVCVCQGEIGKVSARKEVITMAEKKEALHHLAVVKRVGGEVIAVLATDPLAETGAVWRFTAAASELLTEAVLAAQAAGASEEEILAALA
ncbi:MAG: hypothetical protein HY978_02585 [Candidatus Liptonbacteria bacterium]|nr:hypothetical protein [Candidatus Liptonbacteria bacterium]